MKATATNLPGTLTDWLSFLETRRPEHQMVLGLERADRVARTLLPAEIFTNQRRIKVITVAGTNGKGSTVATLSALLKAAGIRAGAWTSPHLQQFNERICIDGEMVADPLISDAFARIETLRGDDFLSYFEFGALAALDIFVRNEVDVIVLEVGIGGRLDAVNIIDADVSIVTTVDLDHQVWLGDTIEDIAREKAGIFRSGRPAICGEHHPANSLTDYIRTINACELRRGEAFELDASRQASTGEINFRCRMPHHSTGHQSTGEDTARQLTHLPAPPLPLTSVACALQAFLWLYPETPDQIVRQGLADSRLSGRCQMMGASNVLGEPVTVLLDVAHNPQAARYLAEKVAGLEHPVAVMGILNDKSLEGVIDPLRQMFAHWHVATLDFPLRTRSGRELEQALQAVGEPVTCHETVADALAVAVANAAPATTVVVFGSFHTVAEAMTALR